MDAHVKRLLGFKQLEAGWDSYGARRISRDAVDAAVKIVAAVSPVLGAVTRSDPKADGSVIIWFGAVSVEVAFDPEGGPDA